MLDIDTASSMLLATSRWLIIIVCVLLVVAYSCRLAPATWHTIKWRFQALHLTWFWYCGAVGFEAWGGVVWSLSKVPLLPALLWLVISWRTWHIAPPTHARADRVLLDPWRDTDCAADPQHHPSLRMRPQRHSQLSEPTA